MNKSITKTGGGRVSEPSYGTGNGQAPLKPYKYPNGGNSHKNRVGSSKPIKSASEGLKGGKRLPGT